MKDLPFPIKAMATFQALFALVQGAAGIYLIVTGTPPSKDYLPNWFLLLTPPAAAATIWAAIQLWNLKWRGPIATVVLWLLPFFAALPFASPQEILTDASFIEGRLVFILVYAVIVFEFKERFRT